MEKNRRKTIPMKAMNYKTLLTVILTIVCFTTRATTQDFSKNSIKVGAGLGVNWGEEEGGIVHLTTLGYHKHLWKDRLRLGVNIVNGGSFAFETLIMRSQFYKLTSVGPQVSLDILKYKGASIFVGTGVQATYTRGLLGGDGYYGEEYNYSWYYHKIYAGGSFNLGIRYSRPDNRISYEFSPINIHFGTQKFFLAMAKFEIDIRLNTKN